MRESPLHQALARTSGEKSDMVAVLLVTLIFRYEQGVVPRFPQPRLYSTSVVILPDQLCIRFLVLASNQVDCDHSRVYTLVDVFGRRVRPCLEVLAVNTQFHYVLQLVRFCPFWGLVLRQMLQVAVA
jgi:hypothetical protein